MNTDTVRRVLQAVYGSWAGTMIAAGRSDADIIDHLRSSDVGVQVVSIEAGDIAAEARRRIFQNLGTIRGIIDNLPPEETT